MKILFYILGIVLYLLGIPAFLSSSGAFQETTSLLIVLIGTLFLCTASLMGHISKTLKKVKENSSENI